MMIRISIEREIKNLEQWTDLPPFAEEILAAGRALLQMENDLMEREWKRYGKPPAMTFMAQYATGLSPRELGI